MFGLAWNKYTILQSTLPLVYLMTKKCWLYNNSMHCILLRHITKTYYSPQATPPTTFCPPSLQYALHCATL